MRGTDDDDKEVRPLPKLEEDLSIPTRVTRLRQNARTAKEYAEVLESGDSWKLTDRTYEGVSGKPHINWPNEDELTFTNQFDNLPEPRWATTSQLLSIARESKQRGFNRQLPDDLESIASRKGQHILAPITWHDYIEGKPVRRHLRCKVRVATLAGPQDFTADVSEKAFMKLPAVRPVRMVAGPAPQWQEVLDLQAEVVAVLDSELGAASVGAMVKGEWTKDDTVLRKDPVRSIEMARIIADSMRRAAPLYVTEDMGALVEVAANSVGEYQLDTSDLVATHGFSIFETPFECRDEDEKSWPLRALSWSLTDVTATSGKTVPGLIVIGYVDVVRDYNPTEPDDQLNAYFKPGHRWWPQLVTTWPLGQACNDPTVTDERWTASVKRLRHMAAALWLLTEQRISIVRSLRPPRGDRRRAQRMKLPQEVRVVTLRRPEKRHEGGETEREVEWSHRWMVTGHWRRLWDEEHNRVKLVWVSPYIKGPADKPFVPKKVIYKFER